MRNRTRPVASAAPNDVTGEARMHALVDGRQVGRGWARRGHGYQPGRLGHAIHQALRRLA